ncbi:hypothetical protein HanIR_Chr07g0313531 [Helianthus annuus]|nr:hypothetical protein HanIR_Chr07g0313531 [Helianthus annuus]
MGHGEARRRPGTPPPIGPARRLRPPQAGIDGPFSSLLTHTAIHTYTYIKGFIPTP